MYTIEGLALEIPQVHGWTPDENIAAESEAGGTVFRLVRESAIAGSPRIDVYLSPPSPHPITLAAFVAKNRAELMRMQARNAIRILEEDEKPIYIGPRAGVRLRNEYTMGNGGNAITITQLSTLLVLDGRGIAVTAVGRTELFHPLAQSIDAVLSGIRTTMDAHSGRLRLLPSPKKEDSQPTTPKPLEPHPIDLGKIGGGETVEKK